MEMNNQLAVSGFVDTPIKYQKKHDSRSQIFDSMLTRDNDSTVRRADISESNKSKWLLHQSVESYESSPNISVIHESSAFNVEKSKGLQQFGIPAVAPSELTKGSKAVPQALNGTMLIAKELYEQTAFALNKLSYIDTISSQLSAGLNTLTLPNNMQKKENTGLSTAIPSSDVLGPKFADIQYVTLRSSMESTNGKLLEKENVKTLHSSISTLNTPEKSKVLLIETENTSALYIRDHFSSNRDVLASAAQMLAIIKQKISKMFINGREIQ